MVSSDTIFFTPRGKESEAASARSHFMHRDGDHLTLLGVFQVPKTPSLSPSDAGT